MAIPAYATGIERIWHYVFLVFCGAVLFFLVAPTLAIVPLSFNSEPWFYYPLAGFSLRWYHDFFTSVRWQDALYNSVIVAVFATTLATSLGTLAALGLSRGRLPARALIMSLLISPMIVPVVISAVAMYFFYADMSLVNTYPGIILAHTTLATPFVVITVTATLTGFDHTLSRAAASLGAPPFYVFRKVILPIILPGVISGALFAFVTSWDEVVVVLFLASPAQRTLPLQMFSGIREQISPTITAVATMLLVLSVGLLTSVEMLRRRAERLRGVSAT
jgi:putative spermidine/putrescine transport system permease protein